MMAAVSTIPRETLAADYSKKDKTVWKNGYDAYDFFLNGDYLTEIDLRVTNGSKVDVYILSLEEYWNYRDGKHFTPLFARERTRRVDRAHENDLEEGVAELAYLVVDNRNNSRDSDAEPEGSVTYDLEMSLVEEPLPLIAQLLCLGIVIAVVAVVAYIYWKFFRNKGERYGYPVQAPVPFPVDYP